MARAPFVVQPHLTAISLAYRNAAFIADQVLPRVPVLSQAFKWSKYTLEDGFTIPDSRVGRKGAVNRIDWTATESSGITKDYGLEDAIPEADILQAQAAAATNSGVAPIDPEARSSQLLTDLVALDREKRVADLVFALNTYPAAQRTTLAGTTQWSDAVNSDPVLAIMNAMDAMLVRPNVLVFGQGTWTKFRMHPKLTAAIVAAGGNASVGSMPVSRQAVADLFEVRAVLVGQGWYNAAKPGQPASMTRLWGKHAAMLNIPENLLTTEGQVSFGFTAQWLDRVASTAEKDPTVGLRGGTVVRVGESLAETIAAADAGYFFQNAVA